MTIAESPDSAVPDRKKVRAFARSLFGIYTHGALAYMIDLGHRLGLFTAAAHGPATSPELATRAGLDERYVREWLGAMVTAEIMTYDRDAAAYTLPPEHAAALTGPGSKNMGPMAAMVTLLGRNLEGVEEAFRTGGGVPYDAFAPHFTGVMDELNRRPLDELLVEAWLPLAPGLTERLAAGARVADVGCGTGHALAVLGAAFPASTFVGYDLSSEAIGLARAEVADAGLANVSFEVADVSALAPQRPFDVVFAIDAVHDQAAPAEVLRGVHDALTPGGTFVMIDMAASSELSENVGNPFAPWIYSISTLHCMTVSLASGGAGLGAAWGEGLARRMLGEAGFGEVTAHPAPGQGLNLIYVTGRPE
ncbi:class I SAM-dependent methyltransferase [Pseudonocardia sp. KRD291]|uniref:class I SAM-dependent methyltransferase n=1 Tax=Pseudonocardia sp. KRD291 TaxID=2792007 RepID=UPI001C4A625F|nr:methyltransferase domain-containing protein [Pseudonocardia sp. KRD291]MBW0101124.1 methyltransferase domain-containing protein [Pseudonocardia sp. KRD291]